MTYDKEEKLFLVMFEPLLSGVLMESHLLKLERVMHSITYSQVKLEFYSHSEL